MTSVSAPGWPGKVLAGYTRCCMALLLQGAAVYLAVAVGGVAAWGLVRRWSVGAGAAWAVARVVGWVAAGWVGWIAGWAGVRQWWWIAAAVLVLLAAAGWRQWRPVPWRTVVEAEMVGVIAFAAVAVLRFSQMAVAGTEKPMDLAILAVLLRPGTFPPLDPWLAGAALPYYYWGFMPWITPIRLLGLAPDVAFNMLVPTVAAVTAQAAWALARGVGGRRPAAWMAAFLAVLGGTPEGWQQLARGVALHAVDLWQASRGVAGAITEFPLFTFHLGDLHPHLLAVPLALTALFVARAWSVDFATVPRVVATALAYGAAAAANPWIAVPLGLGVLLMVTAKETGFVGPVSGRRIWVQVAATGALGWLLFAPFWLGFSPAAGGLGWVRSPSDPGEMALFLGAMVLAPTLVAGVLVRRLGGLALPQRQLSLALWVLAAVVVAVVTARAVMAAALAVGTVLAVAMVQGKRRRTRPAWALALLALALVAFVEIAFVRDPYGGELYRMNTVFKATNLAFALLAVATPVLLQWLYRRTPWLAAAATVVVLAAGLPQLAALASRVATPPADWSGLAWMDRGDREAAAWLRRQPPGTVVVEAVGEAYSDAARIASASGVPTVLGWENHERVWRGDAVSPELSRRRRLVATLYGAVSAATVREVAGELGADLVVFGSLEERYYPRSRPVVEAAGEVVFRSASCSVVEVR